MAGLGPEIKERKPAKRPLWLGWFRDAAICQTAPIRVMVINRPPKPGFSHE